MNLELIEVEVVEVEKPLGTWTLTECKDEIVRLEGYLCRTNAEIRQRQGEILSDVKARLPHGKFTEFLESMGWKPTTARLRMRQAKEPVEALTPNPSPNDGRGELEVKSAEVAVLVEHKFKVGDKVVFNFDFEPQMLAIVPACKPDLDSVWEIRRIDENTYLCRAIGSGMILSIWEEYLLPYDPNIESFVDAEYIAQQENRTSEDLVENIFNPPNTPIPNMGVAIDCLIAKACNFVDRVGLDDDFRNEFFDLKIAVVDYRLAGGKK